MKVSDIPVIIVDIKQQGQTLSLSIFRMYMKTRNFNVKLVIRTIRQRPDYIFINKMYIRVKDLNVILVKLSFIKKDI